MLRVVLVLAVDEGAWVDEDDPDLTLDPDLEDNSDAEESVRLVRAPRVLEVATDCLEGNDEGPPDTRDGGSLPDTKLLVSRDSSIMRLGHRKSDDAYTYNVTDALPPGWMGSWAWMFSSLYWNTCTREHNISF